MFAQRNGPGPKVHFQFPQTILKCDNYWLFRNFFAREIDENIIQKSSNTEPGNLIRSSYLIPELGAPVAQPRPSFKLDSHL